MFEHAAVVTSKVAVIVDRHAVRIVSAVIIKHEPAVPVRSPRAVTPAVVSKEPNRDSHGEANSESQHQTTRGRQHIIARVGDKGRPPDSPRIVIGNVNESRIDRGNHDRAIVDIYSLLRRRSQRA